MSATSAQLVENLTSASPVETQLVRHLPCGNSAVQWRFWVFDVFIVFQERPERQRLRVSIPREAEIVRDALPSFCAKSLSVLLIWRRLSLRFRPIYPCVASCRSLATREEDSLKMRSARSCFSSSGAKVRINCSCPGWAEDAISQSGCTAPLCGGSSIESTGARVRPSSNNSVYSESSKERGEAFSSRAKEVRLWWLLLFMTGLLRTLICFATAPGRLCASASVVRQHPQGASICEPNFFHFTRKQKGSARCGRSLSIDTNRLTRWLNHRC